MRTLKIRKKDIALTGGEFWCSFCSEIHDKEQLRILAKKEPWHPKFCNDSIPVPARVQHGAMDVDLTEGEHPEEIALRAIESGFWELDKGKRKAKNK